MIIYEMRHPESGLVYVGATTVSLQSRKIGLKQECSRKVKQAFSKYGYDNFVWKILDTARTLKSLQIKERKYIAKYRKINSCVVLNKQIGGGGSLTQVRLS